MALFFLPAHRRPDSARESFLFISLPKPYILRFYTSIFAYNTPEGNKIAQSGKLKTLKPPLKRRITRFFAYGDIKSLPDKNGSIAAIYKHIGRFFRHLKE